MALFAIRNSLLDLDRERHRLTPARFSDQCHDLLAHFSEAAEATHRFDIVLPVQEERYSTFFWRWFHWWNDYLKTLSPGAIGHVMSLAMARGCLDDYRPTGSWVYYRNQQPGFNVLVA